jgi:hypothetical protein
MPTSDVFALQHSSLNQFLFASVGIERDGMMLCPVSVFARQGEDPWREAGRLAGLPKSAAIESFARTIASMPTSVWPLSDARPIAIRLIALLPAPGSAGPNAASMSAQLARVVRTGLFLAAMAFAAAYFAGAFAIGEPPRPWSSAASTLSPAEVPPSPLTDHSGAAELRR